MSFQLSVVLCRRSVAMLSGRTPPFNLRTLSRTFCPIFKQSGSSTRLLWLQLCAHTWDCSQKGWWPAHLEVAGEQLE